MFVRWQRKEGADGISLPPPSFPEKKKEKKDGQTASKDGFIFLLRRVVRKWIDFLTSWHLDIKEYIDLLIGFVRSLMYLVFSFILVNGRQMMQVVFVVVTAAVPCCCTFFSFYSLPIFIPTLDLLSVIVSTLHDAAVIDHSHTMPIDLMQFAMCLLMTGNYNCFKIWFLSRFIACP